MLNKVLIRSIQQLVAIIMLVLCSNVLLGQDVLVIEGKDIWVRETPKTGRVVMKLNTGDTCSVLKKSDMQIIRGQEDFWYYIDFKGEKGWVFGSQTSIKQKASLHNFEPFLKYFMNTTFFGEYINNLIRDKSPKVTRFVKKDIGVHRLFNPGSACVLCDNFEGYIPIFPKVDPLTLYENRSPEGGFCEESKDADGVYYIKVDKLPTYADVVNGTSKQIYIPANYRNNMKIKVDVLKEKHIIKTMYFMIADNKWRLVLIDDCDCSA
ncbi:hypothetical protein [Aquimarina litoralis]|uniref:hypothetical protein n=1 Tax=Aquimarina litoralis TaxID=584605 RepID=UPI001C579626|nr:hypothetical protein [Aquimarina litoralis]MBW1295549.1 hypothetical protein [Aquimarina litoralis]